MKIRALAVLALAAAAVLAVPTAAHAVSGEAAKPAEQIATDAQAAFRKAKSVLMQGTITTDNDQISLDLVAAHGAGGGSMFLNGAKFDLVLHGTDVYFKGGADAWTKLTGNSQLGTLLDERWIKSTTSNPDFASFAKLADVDQIGPSMFSVSGGLTKGKVTQYRGQPAIPLNDSGSEPGTLYVAAKGTAYPLALVRNTGQPGRITFSRYGTAKVPTPPTTALDFDQLKAQSSSS